MERKRFDGSSSIVAAGYDMIAQILEIEFTSGAVYAYKIVPQRIWDEFQVAQSRGTYFQTFIRPCFEFDCIYKPPRAPKEKNDAASEAQEKPRRKPGRPRKEAKPTT